MFIINLDWGQQLPNVAFNSLGKCIQREICCKNKTSKSPRAHQCKRLKRVLLNGRHRDWMAFWEF